ncbi:hypothetical protein [Streptomyces sp. NPDC001340]
MQLAPSALHETAGTLGGYLGWTLNELIIDDIVSLDGPHERQIAMRLNSDGNNIQLWAVGGTEPVGLELVEGIVPLPRGHRWHTWVHIGRLEADRDPATILYDAITDRLMPVFDTKPLFVGHRPWDPEPEVEADTEATVQADSEVTDEPNVEATAQADTAATAETVTAATAQPQPEQQAPADLPAKVVPMPPRRKPADKPNTPAADDKPKARPARKRTPAKPAAAKANTQATGDKPKPRPTRKRTPAKKAADKPTAS